MRFPNKVTKNERRSPYEETEAALEAKAAEIADAMRRLGRRMLEGDQSELVHWIIPGALACAHRPFRYDSRYGGSRTPVPVEATAELSEWAELIQCYGIRGIISLMHDRDLSCYSRLNLGATDLIGFLRQRGFVVAHHPYEDPAHRRTRPIEARKLLVAIRDAALISYDELPKPVLIQCSAGEDRSAPVAAFIWMNRRDKA